MDHGRRDAYRPNRYPNEYQQARRGHDEMNTRERPRDEQRGRFDSYGPPGPPGPPPPHYYHGTGPARQSYALPDPFGYHQPGPATHPPAYQAYGPPPHNYYHGTGPARQSYAPPEPFGYHQPGPGTHPPAYQAYDPPAADYYYGTGPARQSYTPPMPFGNGQQHQFNGYGGSYSGAQEYLTPGHGTFRDLHEQPQRERRPYRSRREDETQEQYEKLWSSSASDLETSREEEAKRQYRRKERSEKKKYRNKQDERRRLANKRYLPKEDRGQGDVRFGDRNDNGKRNRSPRRNAVLNDNVDRILSDEFDGLGMDNRRAKQKPSVPDLDHSTSDDDTSSAAERDSDKRVTRKSKPASPIDDAVLDDSDAPLITGAMRKRPRRSSTEIGPETQQPFNAEKYNDSTESMSPNDLDHSWEVFAYRSGPDLVKRGDDMEARLICPLLEPKDKHGKHTCFLRQQSQGIYAHLRTDHGKPIKKWSQKAKGITNAKNFVKEFKEEEMFTCGYPLDEQRFLHLDQIFKTRGWRGVKQDVKDYSFPTLEPEDDGTKRNFKHMLHELPEVTKACVLRLWYHDKDIQRTFRHIAVELLGAYDKDIKELDTEDPDVLKEHFKNASTLKTPCMIVDGALPLQSTRTFPESSSNDVYYTNRGYEVKGMTTDGTIWRWQHKVSAQWNTAFIIGVAVGHVSLEQFVGYGLRLTSLSHLCPASSRCMTPGHFVLEHQDVNNDRKKCQNKQLYKNIDFCHLHANQQHRCRVYMLKYGLEEELGIPRNDAAIKDAESNECGHDGCDAEVSHRHLPVHWAREHSLYALAKKYELDRFE